MSRSRLARIALSAVLAATATPLAAHAQQARVVTAAAPDAERSALGRKLAEVLNSEALTLAQADKMLDQTVPGLAASNPEMAFMEREHPGVLKAVADAMRPIIVEGTRKKLPELWKRLGAIFAGGMTADELHAALVFYQSPLGARIIKVMGEDSDFSQMLSERLRNDQSDITEQGLRTGLMKGAAGVINRLPQADILAIARFMRTPAGGKIRELTPQIQAAAVAWGNESDPAIDTQIEQAVTRAVGRFVKEHPAK